MSLSAEELDGNHWLARKLARMEKLEKIEAAARSFVDFLSANAGTNADWPIEIKVGLDGAEGLLLSINALDRSLAALRKADPEEPQQSSTSPTPQVFILPSGAALDRPTLLAVRRRVITMYEDLEAHAAKCAEDSQGDDMAANLQRQVMGMRKVRQMLGRMLDEQAGIVAPYTCVEGITDMTAPLQAALSDMVALAQEDLEKGNL